MLEEYKTQVIQLMLGGLYGFNADSFEFSDTAIKAEDKNGKALTMPILSIDHNIENDFIFVAEWFRGDEKGLYILNYNNGFVIINKAKIKAYLVAFKSEIKRLGNGVCSLNYKLLPEDNSYWVVKKRGMTNEEKNRYKSND